MNDRLKTSPPDRCRRGLAHAATVGKPSPGVRIANHNESVTGLAEQASETPPELARLGVIIGNHNETVTGLAEQASETPPELARVGVIIGNHNETVVGSHAECPPADDD